MNCNICGMPMFELRAGVGKGGKGAKRECMHKHRRCPKCYHTLLTKFHPAVCPNCGYKETS